MKKFLFIAAAFAALVGCSKDASTPESAQSFVEGQTVTLSVSAPSSTKMSSKDDGSIKFTWQSGDKILVYVGDESSEFTLKSGAGTSSATFEGKMPASGDSFDAQYPAVDDLPDISSQAYSSTEAVPHDKMFFYTEGCTLDKGFEFEAQYAVLCLNLYGKDQAISSIVVNDGSDSYTLSISPAVTLPTTSETAKPFYIVVPDGTYSFTAEISCDSFTGAVGEFTTNGSTVLSTSSAQKFVAGQVLDMPTKEVSISPTKIKFSSGNMYYNGSEFLFEIYQWAYSESYDVVHVCRFRWAANSGDISADISSATGTGKSLYGSVNDVFFTNSDETTPRADFTLDKETGKWRTLSIDEWDYLLYTRKVIVGGESMTSYGEGNVNGVNGLIILPDNWDGSVCSGFTYGDSDWSNVFTESTWLSMQNAGCIFLPAAGYRDGSNLKEVGSDGYYCSSSPSNASYSDFLYFCSNEVFSYYSDIRSWGHSVRLVYDVN